VLIQGLRKKGVSVVECHSPLWETKEDKTKLGELITKLEKKNLPTALYIFSWGKNEYKGEYSSANIRVEDIPEPIIEVYKEINRI